MSNQPQEERCRRLRELRVRVSEEIQQLKEGIAVEEYDAIETPVETRNVIKSLQNVLSSIDKELQKHPTVF